MKILVINCGSSSLKYQLFDMDGEKVLAKGICEAIGTNQSSAKGSSANGAEFKKVVDIPDHRVAFGIVKDALTSGDTKVIDRLDEIGAIGHRVVQGGDLFTESTLVTDKVVEGIKSLIPLAPLHNAAHITGIECCTEVFGKDVPQVTVFDNAFHSTMPPTSYLFALPYEYYENDHVRRYGAHGTSHRFVAYRAAELMGKDLKDFKLITCHLGNGASITAIKDGKVLDTSMGLTPLDGLPMGTRTGSIDPAIVGLLMDKKGFNTKEIDTYLNKKSGMLGVSGVSSDFRDLTAAINAGNERALLAVKMLAYSIKKFIGAYAAAMNGVDVIVFTAGVGENITYLREWCLEGMEYLGVKLDKEKNNALASYKDVKDGFISAEDSKVKVVVIPTNEELMIAMDTEEIVNSLK